MSIWESEDWKDYYLTKSYRKGVKVDFDKGVNEDVKCAIKNIVSWLRTQYEFPIRLRIYVKQSPLVRARDGDEVLDLFFWPFSRDDEPYIKMATGDYPELLEQSGSHNALRSILFSLLSEITHYFQWLNNSKLPEEELMNEADVCARNIIDIYGETREQI